MRVAIVGAGGAGLMSAWLLQQNHDVVVFESEGRVGGHVHTVAVEEGGQQVLAEIGAEFFFEENYTGLHALITRLGLPTIRTAASAALMSADGRSTLVLPPRDLRALTTCLSTQTLRELFWLGRFVVAGEKVIEERDWSVSIGALLARSGVPRDVADRLIVPLVASSWGVDLEPALELAAYSVINIMGLRAARPPHFFRLAEGFSSYVQRVVADSPRSEVRLRTPVLGLEPTEEGLRVRTEAKTETFDGVILACDWRTAGALCKGSHHFEPWARAFGAFEDYEARVAVHRDTSLMPADPRLWQTTNVSLTREVRPRNTIWSGRPVGAPVFRSWLRPGEPDPQGTAHVVNYRHISVTTKHPARQAALARLQGNDGLFAVGMYTDGIDNHESALRSALEVARRLDPESKRVRWFETQVSR